MFSCFKSLCSHHFSGFKSPCSIIFHHVSIIFPNFSSFVIIFHHCSSLFIIFPSFFIMFPSFFMVKSLNSQLFSPFSRASTGLQWRERGTSRTMPGAPRGAWKAGTRSAASASSSRRTTPAARIAAGGDGNPVGIWDDIYYYLLWMIWIWMIMNGNTCV